MTTFVTYENPRSAAGKATYARTRQLRGIFVWDVSFDCIESAPGSGTIAETPLITAIRAALDTPTHVSAAPFPRVGDLHVYPQPARDVLYISSAASTGTRDEYLVVDALGRTVRRVRADAGTVTLEGLPAGVYTLLVRRIGAAPTLTRFVKN